MRQAEAKKARQVEKKALQKERSRLRTLLLSTCVGAGGAFGGEEWCVCVVWCMHACTYVCTQISTHPYTQSHTQSRTAAEVPAIPDVEHDDVERLCSRMALDELRALTGTLSSEDVELHQRRVAFTVGGWVWVYVGVYDKRG